ncbi:MAG: hypothetical protein WDN45_03610 [Caulobacteraceae bacterium]
MNIGYMEWHEGTPYDCEALSEVSKDELADLEGLLIGKKDEDWRVSEALATIGSHSALGGTAKSTTGPNREVRIRASELLSRAGLTVDFDGLIVEGLQHGTLGQGLAECERLAAQHPSPAVKDALLDGALRSTDGRAVRFVGILFSCTARANEPFDWQQRPFFLRFNTNERKERRAAFDELCAILGIDGSHVTGSTRGKLKSPFHKFWPFAH